MSAPDVDFAILGGGLAGLSLACHLLEKGLGRRRVAVLESRPQYTHDRFWCSWAEGEHPFRSCISQQNLEREQLIMS